MAFGPFKRIFERVCLCQGRTLFLYGCRGLQVGDDLADFSLKVGCEDPFPDIFPDLFKTPEAASVQFVRGRDRAIVGRAVDKDQFPFAGGLENIVCDSLGSEIGDAQLFAHFASEGLFHTLTQVHMPAHGCIPFAWLDVFPYGTLLQIELALGVEYMQVDHGVQQFAPVVAFAPGGRAQDVALLVDHGKQFFVIVLLHIIIVVDVDI